MKFQDLNEQERIRRTKNELILTLQRIARDPSKVSELIKLEQFNPVVPKYIKLTDKMSAEDKIVSTALNREADEKARLANIALKEQEDAFNNSILGAIAKLEKSIGCTCETCFNFNAFNSIIPAEIEPLIDIARNNLKLQTF